MIALIDADVLLYKFSHHNEDDIVWAEDCVVKDIDFDRAVFELNSFVEALKERLCVSEARMVLSGSKNFRYDVDPTYKHNRVDREPSELRPLLREYIWKNFWTISRRRLEGDDCLGIISTQLPGKFIVCTIDKDLKQIPGKHYNWDKDLEFEITPEEGEHFLLTQIITGDPGDGYPGCPGVGAKGAAEFLKAPYCLEPYDYAFKRGKRKGEVEVRYDKVPTDSVWGGIVSLYEAKGLNEEDAIKQARMAKILTHELWDSNTDDLILWEPSKHLKEYK